MQHYFGKDQVLQTNLLEGAMVRSAVCWVAGAVSAGPSPSNCELCANLLPSL